MSRSSPSPGASPWRMLAQLLSRPRRSFVPSLLFPLFFFTAFAGGLSGIAQRPGFDFPDGYTAFQFVFVLLQSAAFAGVFTGFGIARDFESGFARRLLLAAPHRTRDRRSATRSARSALAHHGTLLTLVALAAGMKVGGERGRPARPLRARRPDERRRRALGRGRGDAAADDAGRADHADAGLPRPLLRPRLRAACTCSPAGSTARGRTPRPRARGRARLLRRHRRSISRSPSACWAARSCCSRPLRGAACAQPSAQPPERVRSDRSATARSRQRRQPLGLADQRAALEGRKARKRGELEPSARSLKRPISGLPVRCARDYVRPAPSGSRRRRSCRDATSRGLRARRGSGRAGSRGSRVRRHEVIAVDRVAAVEEAESTMPTALVPSSCK